MDTSFIVEAVVTDGELNGVYERLFPIVNSGEWTLWPEAEQISFAENLKLAYEALGVIRQAFDQTIYKGHETGKVKTTVKPVRAKPDFKNGTPGRAAPTAMEVLARKVKS